MIGRFRVALLGVALVSACAATRAGAFAQVPEVHDSPVPAASADITIDADVHMQSLRFDSVPNRAHLKVSGTNQQGGYRVIRTHVPEHPRNGTTYRNVRIQLQATSRFVDPHGPSSSPSPAGRRP